MIELPVSFRSFVTLATANDPSSLHVRAYERAPVAVGTPCRRFAGVPHMERHSLMMHMITKVSRQFHVGQNAFLSGRRWVVGL